ncbi:FtsX-like permease family protein [Solimonas sp. C16B3]|uniref:FtsX-like permease family protein n=2 Tax=Solimonas marina TaxID=2714601 RepID=A0A969WD94_9GAMM|nr:FtsX-like permease family protein [Solimonas marina]
MLFVPWQPLQKSLNVNYLNSITVAAKKAGETSHMSDEIKKLLRKRHGITGSAPTDAHGYLAQQGGVGGTPDDFTVQTQAGKALTKGLYTPAAAFALANLPKLDEVTLEEMADTLDRSSDTMTALLASIAGVSLIVGGIGIMNIMLVSVTERTREIGLRMATGARSSDVALQFLIEAVTLSVLGGIIGLVLGLLASRIVGWSLGWPTSVPYGAMALSIGIAAAVGLLFGSYPARRASLLDPIDALRTE